MNIDWIETFLDVFETRNFNTTALNLNVTQSTVSHRIQKLEDAIGARLFRRGRAGAEPTSAGHDFAVYARNLARDWNNARNVIGQSSQGIASLRIGLQYDLAKVAAGDVLAVVRAIYPDISLYVEVDYSQQMTRDVERGDLDFALIYTPSTKADLYNEYIGMLSYSMVAKDAVAYSTLKSQDYIFPNISPAFAEEHRHLHPHLNHAILHCGQSDSIGQFIQIRGGASYVVSKLAAQLVDGGLFAVKNAPLMTQSLYFCSHISTRTKGEFKRVRSLFGSLPILTS